MESRASSTPVVLGCRAFTDPFADYFAPVRGFTRIPDRALGRESRSTDLRWVVSIGFLRYSAGSRFLTLPLSLLISYVSAAFIFVSRLFRNIAPCLIATHQRHPRREAEEMRDLFILIADYFTLSDPQSPLLSVCGQRAKCLIVNKYSLFMPRDPSSGNDFSVFVTRMVYQQRASEWFIISASFSRSLPELQFRWAWLTAAPTQWQLTWEIYGNFDEKAFRK